MVQGVQAPERSFGETLHQDGSRLANAFGVAEAELPGFVCTYNPYSALSGFANKVVISASHLEEQWETFQLACMRTKQIGGVVVADPSPKMSVPVQSGAKVRACSQPSDGGKHSNTVRRLLKGEVTRFTRDRFTRFPHTAILIKCEGEAFSTDHLNYPQAFPRYLCWHSSILRVPKTQLALIIVPKRQQTLERKEERVVTEGHEN